MSKLEITIDIIASKTTPIITEVQEAMAMFSGLDGLKRCVHTRHSSFIKAENVNILNYDSLVELYKKETAEKGFKVYFIYLIAIKDTETDLMYSIDKYFLDPEFKYMSDGIKYLEVEKALDQLGYTFDKDDKNNITNVKYDPKNNK